MTLSRVPVVVAVNSSELLIGVVAVPAKQMLRYGNEPSQVAAATVNGQTQMHRQPFNRFAYVGEIRNL